MSVYFHATQEEMEDVADDFVLTQAAVRAQYNQLLDASAIIEPKRCAISNH
jgi:hypothetical protein